MVKKEIKKTNKNLKSDITPEFKRILKKLIKKHEDVLRELAKR